MKCFAGRREDSQTEWVMSMCELMKFKTSLFTSQRTKLPAASCLLTTHFLKFLHYGWFLTPPKPCSVIQPFLLASFKTARSGGPGEFIFLSLQHLTQLYFSLYHILFPLENKKQDPSYMQSWHTFIICSHKVNWLDTNFKHFHIKIFSIEGKYRFVRWKPE